MSIVLRLVVLAGQAVVMYLLAQMGYWLVVAVLGIVAVLPFVGLLGQRLERSDRRGWSQVVIGFAVLLLLVGVGIGGMLLFAVLAKGVAVAMIGVLASVGMLIAWWRDRRDAGPRDE